MPARDMRKIEREIGKKSELSSKKMFDKSQKRC